MAVPTPPAPPALELASTGISPGALAITAQLGERPQRTRISVRTHAMNVLAGHDVLVAGRLFGVRGALGLPGRMIVLQALARRGWHTIARARTTTNGRYRLRFIAKRAGTVALRLRFAGDSADASSHRRLGAIDVYRLARTAYAGGNNPTLGRFEACVVNAESSGNRWSSNGADFSFYQWTPETYNVAARMAHLRQRANPTEASLEEQTWAFRAYEPSHPGAWPSTVPMCS